MTIQVRFTSSPVCYVDRGAICSSPMEDVIPGRTYTGDKLADILATFDVFVADVAATGKPAALDFYAVRARGARKPAGFDNAAGTRYLNLHKAPQSYAEWSALDKAAHAKAA